MEATIHIMEDSPLFNDPSYFFTQDRWDGLQNLLDKMGKLGGDGGLFALDKNGKMAMPFNTEGMYRGAITSNGQIEIQIYK